MFTVTPSTVVNIKPLLTVLLISLLFMVISEVLMFNKHIAPIKQALLCEHPNFATLEKAYHQTHRFPVLTVKRILGPHLFGLSIPAMLLTYFFISTERMTLSYHFIMYAFIGAIIIAGMHALIEYYQAMIAIEPVLQELYEKAKTNHKQILSIDGSILVSLKTKFRLSIIFLGGFPLTLFGLVVHFTFIEHSLQAHIHYWLSISFLIGVCLLLSLYGSTLLYYHVTNPIWRLQADMREVEKGNFEVVAPDYNSDEFSGLLYGFNHMVQGLKERDVVNKQLNESFIATLAAALDARDHYTAGHSIRVATYAVEIGKRANLSAESLQLLKETALLHDIGKIGIPDHILLKDGPLSDEEYEEIKKHPVLGEEILRQVQPEDVMKRFLPGVRSHHERIDGKGYPDRLQGHDIPMMGRILAVADAYDAMTSDRPYRKGMTSKKAAEILKSGKGTQWDARFVDYFTQWLAEMEERM
ncbi:HD-GYP domain-containing protein [Alkalihalobacterium bogoriense]|uniref:HD-GYP domain-containing protein n=1 Tax=Alkalihalobacterium bogoriense TaxID=246272 RepID=UPI000AAFAB0D|nr:HD domain-containing phosphohydrolase [Alkalihalobacterium bogoriense]